MRRRRFSTRIPLLISAKLAASEMASKKDYDHVWDFKSYGDLINAAEASPNRGYSREATSEFQGYVTFDDAIKLARQGWPEGSLKIAQLSNVLTDKITSLLDATTINYDVTGNDFDVAMYLQDLPEHWFTLETCEGASNRMIRVIFNIATSGDIPAEVMMAKGTAIVALIMALETAAIRVQAEIVHCVFSGHKVWKTQAALKDADQPLDIDRLAFALAHPASLRRLMFAVEEDTMGVGSPTELKDVPTDAIYIGRSFTGEPQWTSETETLAWIKTQLTAQGVHLSE